MTQSMDSYGHQQVLCITMTLILILSLFYVYASNNYVLDHCVCVGSYYALL